MKILYDHQAFSLQAYGGITRSFYEIIKHIEQLKLGKWDLALKYTKNRYVLEDSLILCKTFGNRFRFPGQGTLFYGINQNEGVRRIKQGDFDVFHPTYYDPYFLKYLEGKPFVLTIHDMIHELFPTYFPKTDKVAKQKKMLAAKANRIIAVSENTKKDIIRLLGIDPDKIEVVYHGSSFIRKPSTPMQDVQIPKRFILFVGNRGAYKNFDFFVKALAPILKDDPDLKLVCVGGGGLTGDEKELLLRLKIEDKIKYFAAGYEMMLELYSKAMVFVFPSLYEGFGIPVLEAFSCGCPVILCNVSSLPEVGGKAALYFESQDSISLETAMKQVLGSEELREQLIKRGFERLKDFSWEQTALKTIRVYETAINKGKL